MDDDINKELAKLKQALADQKAKVEALERAAKPPEPFKPQPYQQYDPTAGMCMPPSVLRDMIAAEPRGFMREVAMRDARAPTSPGTIPREQMSSPSGGSAGSGTGWVDAQPIGPSPHQRYVDAQLDAQDLKDRRELIEQKAREQALLKAVKE
jgi:hypothetical protein